jgi:hypothetical protein
MKYFVSDGYFPNGESRPKREVKLIEKQGDYHYIRYKDIGEAITVLFFCIEEVEETKQITISDFLQSLQNVYGDKELIKSVDNIEILFEDVEVVNNG